jgi:hypothetical protein
VGGRRPNPAHTCLNIFRDYGLAKIEIEILMAIMNRDTSRSIETNCEIELGMNTRGNICLNVDFFYIIRCKCTQIDKAHGMLQCKIGFDAHYAYNGSNFNAHQRNIEH